MDVTTTTTSIHDFTGHYGTDFRPGILSDHLIAVEDAGFTVRPVDDTWVATGEDATIVPIVCSEIIAIATEDGPATGRCGLPVDTDGYACEGHAAEIASWHAQSELERLAWERDVAA